MATSKTQRTGTKTMKPYTFLGCPLTRNRSAWCYRMCTPDAHKHGRCGRIAPHAFKSRIQQSIEKFNQQTDAAD